MNNKVAAYPGPTPDKTGTPFHLSFRQFQYSWHIQMPAPSIQFTLCSGPNSCLLLGGRNWGRNWNGSILEWPFLFYPSASAGNRFCSFAPQSEAHDSGWPCCLLQLSTSMYQTTLQIGDLKYNCKLCSLAQGQFVFARNGVDGVSWVTH